MTDLRPVPKADNKDPAYLEHCRDLCRSWIVGCFICAAKNDTVVPHHVRGKRRFGDKANIITLCGRCHREIHHFGRDTFCTVNHITVESLVLEAKRFYAKFLDECK